MQNEKFQSLVISGWRQFNSIQINFHPRITIITGANGAGKSTILKILAQHFGWDSQLLATPEISKDGKKSFFSGIFKKILGDSENSAQSVIGHLTYQTGHKSPLSVPQNGGIRYDVQIGNQRQVLGLNIPSHRPVPAYQQVGNIPTNPIRAENAYETYFSETKSRYQNNHTQFGPIYRMKEAIISMAIFGAGNQHVQKDIEVEKLFHDFKEILSKILPSSIGFRDISIRIPDVVIVTDTGNFVLDAASGGLMSLVDLAWQIFLYSHDKEEFSVIFDEPENHLHPAMQRSLIRKLLDAFPKAQFIIATHSPFIVSSVKDSAVYVLKYDEVLSQVETGINSRVSSMQLDNVNKAGTASEILRDVLGIPVTLPEWAEGELYSIAKDFKIDEINTETINTLRSRLDEAGLGEYYPDALKQIAVQR
ncbi:MAG: AAA family ATPase [Proteobacteria bacterium]|nr:AAA family ATPase [Pseudomonadota bacterium]